MEIQKNNIERMEIEKCRNELQKGYNLSEKQFELLKKEILNIMLI